MGFEHHFFKRINSKLRLAWVGREIFLELSSLAINASDLEGKM
jgi:hypothetical protein